MLFGVREKGDVTILDLVGEIRLAAEASPSVQALVKEQLAAGKKRSCSISTKSTFSTATVWAMSWPPMSPPRKKAES